jgi:two-component system response regulator YesN
VKVLIIEDEAVIRRGIIKKVSWQKYPITEVLEADNGQSGYEMILRENPEIIVLDLCLPKMNGIAVLKQIREAGIDAKVIILSGIDEFDYAQQAIKYGADNYLLKPSTPQEIEEVLQKVCADIYRNGKKEKDYAEMKRKLQAMIPYFQSGLINTIITGDFTDEHEISSLSSYLNLNIHAKFYIAVVIMFENRPPNQSNPEDLLLNKLEVCQRAADLLDQNNVIIEGSLSGRVLLLLSGQEATSLRKNCFSMVDRLINGISQRTAKLLIVGIGNVGTGIRGIRNSYEEALVALENRFVGDCNQIYFIGDIALDDSCFFDFPFQEEKKLLNLIKVGKKEDCLEIIDDLVGFFKAKKEKYSINLLKIHLQQLAYAMVQIVYELGGTQSDLYGEEHILESLEEFIHIDEYHIFLNDFTAKLCDYISKKRYLKYTSILRKAILYIEQNYMDENLSLEKIADHIGMHPNYVSHLFKKEKGESLTGYICRYRITKAAEAIVNTDALKVSEIAYNVGFNDAHYFTTCFKNILGATPSEYKQIMK